MLLIDRPYQVKLFHALNIYRDVMRKFIIHQLQPSPTATMDAIRDALWASATEQFDKNFKVDNELEATIDVGWFKAIIESNWNPSFNSAFIDEKGRILSDLDLISDIRNKVVHPTKYDFKRPEALNALETIEQLLRSLDARAEADAVQKIFADNPDAQDTLVPKDAIVPPREVERIAETVAQRVEPIVEMVHSSNALTEEMKQTLGKQMAIGLTPLLDTLESMQGQIVEEIVGRIEPLVGATKQGPQHQVLPSATEELMETLAALNQGLRALEARITDASSMPVKATPPSTLSSSLASKPPSERAAPSSIADMWLGVVDDLRTVKVNQFNLGSLFKDCQPIDVWVQRDPEKLILPFRHDFHLSSIQEVMKDPRGREAVEKAITNNFARSLDFECILDRPPPS